MAGTKRRRGGGSSGGSSKQSSTYQVLSNLLEISNSVEQSLDTLQGFCDGRCWNETSNKKQLAPPHWGCYWILLSTHVINRLMESSSSLSSSSSSRSTRVVLSAFCDGVTKVLLSDKTKLERASHSAASRSILARAMLTTTVASLFCLEHHDHDDDDEKDEASTKSLIAAVTSLDRIVHTKSSSGLFELDDGWNLDELEVHCRDIASVEGEEACIACLFKAAEESASSKAAGASSSPPSSKRTARTRRGGSKASSPTKQAFVVDTTSLHASLEKIFQNSNQRIDGRVAVKRWGSMALVWFCQGQLQLLQTAHHLLESSAFDVSRKARLMNKLVDVASEAGNNCGLRAPTGGMDQYLRSITSEGKGTKRTKLVRVDIRDWATIVIYDLVQMHRKCLQDVVSAKVVNEYDVDEYGDVVKDDDELNSENDHESSLSVAPNLATVLSNLCRAAASSVANSTFSEQNEWTKCLMSIATSLCLQLSADPDLPLDCKVTNYALTHLADCLRHLEQHASSVHAHVDEEEEEEDDDDDDENNDGDIPGYNKKWERMFSLQTPLSMPSEASITIHDESSFSTTNDCTFAGVLQASERGRFKDEDAIAIAIRALRNTSNESDVPTATLVSTLTDIVRRVYDTRKPNDIEYDGMVAGTDTKGRKRPARGGGRRSKRRKVADQADFVAMEPETTWHQISNLRALVATEALNALRFCLVIQSKPTSQLRNSIRQTLSTEHFVKLIELGELLDRVLIKTRLDDIKGPPSETDATNTAPEIACSASTGYQANDFTDYEKSMWSAHMKMCQVLGCGRPSFDRNLSSKPILGLDSARKSIYQALAESTKSTLRKEWPLVLPAAHHSFLVANLTSEPLYLIDLAAKFIVDACIESIAYQLENIDYLIPKKWKDDQIYLDDEIPFSHRDARTFILAVSRLPVQQQWDCLEQMVKVILNALESIKGNDEKCEVLFGNGEASSFIARILVVCTSLVDIVTFGPSLRPSLFGHVGSVEMELPRFVTNAEWYRCERCFMGVFRDWESAMLDTNLCPSLFGMKEKIIKELRSIFNISFELGFDTAQNDQCHLLFAAWNGLGKFHSLGVFGRLPYRIELPPSPQVSDASDLSNRITQLRDDACFVHSDINHFENSRGMGPSRRKMNLKRMLDKAEGLIDSTLAEYVPEGSEIDQVVPTAAFALLAAIPAYISSSVAGHTKQGNDFFSTTLSKTTSKGSKQKRGYSSESDLAQSDVDSVESDRGRYDSDARVDASSRLRECCEALGAAPIHPDWLDVSCKLREGIRHAEAVDAAQKAIRILTRLAVTAFMQYKRYSLECIKAFHVDGNSIDKRANLCLNLCQLSSHEPDATSMLGPGPYHDDRAWIDDIATVCELHQDVLELMLDDSVTKNMDQAKASWCPNAAQRLGHLQVRLACNAELRACGEWEVLISEALAISCLDIKRFPNELPESTKLEFDEDSLTKGHSALTLAKIWQTIYMTATSHLMPAAALLRLGLGKGGRKPHPFSFHENNQDPYDVAPLQLSERISGMISPSMLLKKTVFETLNFLARACAEGDDSFTVTCHAIASHLVVDSKEFADLEGLQYIRFAFTGLTTLRELMELSSIDEGALEAAPFLVERLIAVIEDFGRIPKSQTGAIVKSSEEFLRLLSFFGAPGLRVVDTVVENSVEVFRILTTGNSREHDEESMEAYQWYDKDRQSLAIAEIVSALCRDSLQANERTRSCLALLLSRIADLETLPTFPSKSVSTIIVVPSIINAFNSIDDERLKNLILRDLCCLPPPQDFELLEVLPRLAFRKDLANIFAFLLSSRGRSEPFKRSLLLFETLIESFEDWSLLKHGDREHILDLLFLYGCRFDSLNKIGSQLVSRASSTTIDIQTGEIKLLTKFFRYVLDLQAALSESTKEKQKTTTSASKDLDKREGIKTRGGSDAYIETETTTKYPRSCSFVQKSGFHGQHWYNCYTCGLVWDKGCCTLCALVCHRDHDVSYSRYSSFFCDCGAEDGNAIEQNRVSCKCLSPLVVDQVQTIFKSEAARALIERTSPHSESSDIRSAQAANKAKASSVGIEIAKDSFHDVALASINNFTGYAEKSPWFDSLFRIVRQQHDTWERAMSTKSALESLRIVNSDLQPSIRISHQALRKNLRNRRMKILNLQHLSEKTMIPARAAKGFQVRMSSDTSTNAHLLSRLSRRDVSRSILVADSRGRMIIAEPCSLVFVSAIPAVSLRYVNRPYEIPLTRNQMCILGSSPIKFNIVGLRTCADNERHLVVWGTSEACIAILKPNWNGVEERIDLIFDLDKNDDSGDYLVKCEWIPGSQTHIAVGCSRFVRIYDISRSDGDKRALPVIGYNLGFEASLRDFAIVPYKGYDAEEDEITESMRAFHHDKISKMFLLLENGRLHVVDLKTGSNGRLESPGDQHFEPSECVSLATSGVRPRIGSSIGQPGSSTRTLGEGSRLAYLKQSRVLLYKCTSSCVLALMLNAKGDVEGTFELVPSTISSDILGTGNDGYSITGPFTNWTELGIAYRGGEAFFRVACVGRSSKNNQPKLLCIEFNENDVKIKEIVWLSGSSIGLGLSLNVSFEGLATFSVPFLSDMPGEKRFFGERCFLCAVTSNGSFLFFGEETVDTLPVPRPDINTPVSSPLTLVNLSGIAQVHAKKPIFPLTFFESLKNVSDSDDVVFGGEGIESDPDDLKARLSRDSSSSFICPRREGCTLTISLRPKVLEKQVSRSGDSRLQAASRSQAPNNDSVIAAVRILVGSTSNYIPSKIYLQGRPVDLTPRVKKWYSLPLTDEEIALSVRSGMLTIGIGPSFDSSNNVVVDSIEVYAAKRKSIETWLPKSYFGVGGNKVPPCSSTQYPVAVPSDYESGSKGLISSVRALSFLCELADSSKVLSESDRNFLRKLIQDTALDRDKKMKESVHELLGRLEPDSFSRRSFHDESILFGCSKTLNQSKEMTKEAAMLDDEEDKSNQTSKWSTVRLVLQDCLKAATSIARERPMNYLQSMENIVESKVSSGSIAVDASKLILEGFRRSSHFEDLIGGPSGIIDLCLTEMAIELNTDAPQSKQFIKFDVIRAFLESGKVTVIERSCEAISSFCRNRGGVEQTKSGIPDLFTLLFNSRLAYQCDSCAQFPVKEIRYTLLEEGYDIDLCKNCFKLGKNFAETKNFDPNVDVIVNGKMVGGNAKLTCAQMRQMQPVPVEKMEVETSEVHVAGPPGAAPSDAPIAIRLGLGESIGEDLHASDLPAGFQEYEHFVGHLFSNIVELLSSILKRDGGGHQLSPLIRLLLDLVRHSRNEDSKTDRARRFAKELSHGVSQVLILCTGRKKLPQDRIVTLVTCLRAFTNLLAPEADSQYYLAGSQPDEYAEENRMLKAKDKTNPKYVCDVHNLPAVRRRCARGIHKDRRFYVCGKARGQRCKYFVWADEVEKGAEEKSTPMSHFHEVIQAFLWSHLAGGGVPLHARLCSLLEDEVFGEDADCDVSFSLTSTSNDKKSVKNELKSFYDAKAMKKDLADGVFCSREKLQDVVSGQNIVKAELEGIRGLTVPARTSGYRGAPLLEASLDLLTLIANHQTEGISRWFSLLCEINISTNKPSSLRALAKKVLKTLCGGKGPLYRSVRDHFAFSFQLKSLYRDSSSVLETALIVKEKARQCTVDWATSKEISWSNLRVGDLIGTEDLISEDVYTQLCAKKVGMVLDELWGIIKNRGGSWRRFCGLKSLPHSYRERVDHHSTKREGESCLSEVAPIVALFWIGSALTGTNQIKMLRLIDFALTNWMERKSARSKPHGESSSDEDAMSGEEEIMSMSEEAFSVPEEILLRGERKLTIDGVVAFAMNLVHGGRTLELRRAAYQVIMKICAKLSTGDRGLIFQQLISSKFNQIGLMGKTCVEYLNLLESLSRSLASSAHVGQAADLLMRCFVQQMNAVKFDRSNGEWAVLEYGSGVSTVKKKFDLSDCVYCLRPHHFGPKDAVYKPSDKGESPSRIVARSSSSGSNPGGGNRSSSSGIYSRSQPQRKWHLDQVSPYTRGRLDNGKDSSSSNEFCSFYSLKYRLVISDIHLKVNDPRGRFVKVINVYISPRPVSDVSVLKSTEFSGLWQRCATINLPRGASRASTRLTEPIVASNIKIEFCEFYERPGGSKASDGSLLVHCPRCTRVVTNAHGVCGNCGEVAFQCRKCRHINYDRLDAFLCVECGYCASGSFSFELTAGVATNAVAISNDADRERAVRIIGATTSIHEDLRHALKGKIRGVSSRKKFSSNKQNLDSLFNPAMKRAILGLPPTQGSTEDDSKSSLDLVDKPGSVVKFVARPNGSNVGGRSSVAVDRTRSLLRLARQIRSESDSSPDRRRSSDVIIRHLGRGLAIDPLEDENDLIGLLEGDSVLDSSEPLSRVIASVQSRRRTESGRAQLRQGTDESGRSSSSKKGEPGREIMDECQKLHMLMREAERERHELNRRLKAWDRLESGSLTETCRTPVDLMSYTPSHCSVCGTTVALQMLILWLKLFLASPSDVYVGKEFLCLLLEDGPTASKGLTDCKHQVVREIATKSPSGAKLVLAELRKRLIATNDMTSAEILGKIMEVDGFSMAEEYTKLAMEVLTAQEGSRS